MKAFLPFLALSAVLLIAAVKAAEHRQLLAAAPASETHGMVEINSHDLGDRMSVAPVGEDMSVADTGTQQTSVVPAPAPAPKPGVITAVNVDFDDLGDRRKLLGVSSAAEDDVAPSPETVLYVSKPDFDDLGNRRKLLASPPAAEVLYVSKPDFDDLGNRRKLLDIPPVADAEVMAATPAPQEEEAKGDDETLDFFDDLMDE